MDIGEQLPPNPRDHVIQKIQDTIRNQGKTKLTEADLVAAHILSPHQQLSELIEATIIDPWEAAQASTSSLYTRLPSPMDATVLPAAETLFDIIEAETIILHALDRTANPITPVLPNALEMLKSHASTELDTLNSSIIAEITQGHGATHPNNQRNLDILKRVNLGAGRITLDRIVPTLVRVNDTWCYSLTLPTDYTAAKSSMFSPSLRYPSQEQIIVTDPQTNAKITDTLLASPNVLRLLVAHDMYDVQRERISSLFERVHEASRRKDEQHTGYLADINAPIRAHGFSLLHEEAMQHAEGITAIKVKRNVRHHYPSDNRLPADDEAMFADLFGNTHVENGIMYYGGEARTYHISAAGDDLLVMWISSYDAQSHTVRVTREKNGQLGYAVEPSGDTYHPEDAIRPVQAFFGHMEAIRDEDHGYTPAVVFDQYHIHQARSPLLATTTITEFFSTLNANQILPRHDYAVQTGRVFLTVDSSKQSPSSESANARMN